MYVAEHQVGLLRPKDLPIPIKPYCSIYPTFSRIQANKFKSCSIKSELGQQSKARIIYVFFTHVSVDKKDKWGYGYTLIVKN